MAGSHELVDHRGSLLEHFPRLLRVMGPVRQFGCTIHFDLTRSKLLK